MLVPSPAQLLFRLAELLELVFARGIQLGASRISELLFGNLDGPAVVRYPHSALFPRSDHRSFDKASLCGYLGALASLLFSPESHFFAGAEVSTVRPSLAKNSSLDGHAQVFLVEGPMGCYPYLISPLQKLTLGQLREHAKVIGVGSQQRFWQSGILSEHSLAW